MKKFLIAAAFVPFFAWAGADDVRIDQRNSTDSGTITRTLASPSSDAFLTYFTGTKLPGWTTLDPTYFAINSGQLTLNIPGQVQSNWTESNSALPSFIKNKPTFATVAFTGLAADISGLPGGTVTSITAGAGLLGGTITSSGTISLPDVVTSGTYRSVTVDAKGRVTSGTNPIFNFSQPSSRTLTASTSYQATDPSKASVIYPTYACTNATQVLASSSCTVQVRIGPSALTCSTGTLYYTQELSVNLGVLITQASKNPVPIFLPIGGYFIICPTVGTFAITTVEQTAN